MSAQASGVFSVGVEPPPDRMLPSFQVVIGVSSANTRVALGLRHLPDLLLERHAREQVGHALSHRQVRVLVRRAAARRRLRPAPRPCREDDRQDSAYTGAHALLLSGRPASRRSTTTVRGRGQDDAQEPRFGRRKIDGGQLALAGAGGNRLVPVRAVPARGKRVAAREVADVDAGVEHDPADALRAAEVHLDHWPGCWAVPLVQRVVASSSTGCRVRRRRGRGAHPVRVKQLQVVVERARLRHMNVASAPPGSV